jgi:hypothetical protein
MCIPSRASHLSEGFADATTVLPNGSKIDSKPCSL